MSPVDSPEVAWMERFLKWLCGGEIPPFYPFSTHLYNIYLIAICVFVMLQSKYLFAFFIFTLYLARDLILIWICMFYWKKKINHLHVILYVLFRFLLFFIFCKCHVWHPVTIKTLFEKSSFPSVGFVLERFLIYFSFVAFISTSHGPL